MKKIILASGSPRRNAILKNLGIPYEQMPSMVESKVEVNEADVNSPYEWVKLYSSKKAHEINNNVSGDLIIIGADTIVTQLGSIMEKPLDEIDAYRMLKKLQGKKHTVYTGLTLIFKNEDGSFTEENYVDATDVYMREASDEEIKKYIATKEPFDKAGSYAIQGLGSFFVEYINGDYYTVVGLPISVLVRAFKDHGIDLLDYCNKSK